MMLTKAMLKCCHKFLMQNVTTCICRCCQIGLCPTQSPDLFGMSSAYLTASSFIVTDQQPTMHCNMGDTTDQNTSNTPFSNLIVHKQECVCVCECVPYQKQSCVASGDFHHYLDPAALIITSAPQCCHRCKQMFTKVSHQYCSTIATAVEACVAGNICGLLLM